MVGGRGSFLGNAGLAARTGIYRGRYAPSPSGPLHFGSLVAAVGSYLEARCRGGEWYLRIEDIDPPRVLPGAAHDIIATLGAYGFEWSGEVVFQSQRTQHYAAAFERLKSAGRVYPCSCTRKEIADSAIGGPDGPVYPGHCRDGATTTGRAPAWRLRTHHSTMHFDDLVQGPVTQNLGQVSGDFVVRRADGVFTYQLAVVIDDAAQGITHVVRGADLLSSTIRQIFLQQQLQLPTPRYAHVPVVLNKPGEKLSKQTGAKPLNPANAASDLMAALSFLGHAPPIELAGATNVQEVWRWSFEHWRLMTVPRILGQTLDRAPTGLAAKKTP